MKRIILFMVGLAMVFTLACSSAERRAQRAERRHYDSATEVNQERLRLVDEYKKCINKAGADRDKSEACDQYLKAAEALQ